MPAPTRPSVATGQVRFDVKIEGPNLDTSIQVVLSEPNGEPTEAHWTLADALWTRVKSIADNLAASPATTSVVAHREVEYAVVDTTHPDDTYIAE